MPSGAKAKAKKSNAKADKSTPPSLDYNKMVNTVMQDERDRLSQRVQRKIHNRGVNAFELCAIKTIVSKGGSGGQGFGDYHEAMQQAVFNGDASGLEDVAGRSGSDGATAVCYLYEAYDGQQPGGCPTM